MALYMALYMALSMALYMALYMTLYMTLSMTLRKQRYLPYNSSGISAIGLFPDCFCKHM